VKTSQKRTETTGRSLKLFRQISKSKKETTPLKGGGQLNATRTSSIRWIGRVDQLYSILVIQHDHEAPLAL